MTVTFSLVNGHWRLQKEAIDYWLEETQRVWYRRRSVLAEPLADMVIRGISQAGELYRRFVILVAPADARKGLDLLKRVPQSDHLVPDPR